MASLQELRKERKKKLEILRDSGINPYPSQSNRTHSIAEAHAQFDEISQDENSIWLSGRIMALRKHGGSVFLDLYDGTDTIQGYLKKDLIGEDSFSLFDETIDIGDFVELHGHLFETNRGEETIKASEWRILAKSLRPLPEKWHGLQDQEQRYRKRYLDMLFNPEVREMIEKKSRFWNAVREFLQQKGFLEVQTPVLETTTGGAEARPFQTYHNALDMEVYLRISAGELWQKQLMVGGFDKVFEIGRIFRNEGMSPEHLQDYMQVEFYWAYADYKAGMELVKEMYRYVAEETFGTQQFTIGEFEIDLSSEWEHYDYVETVKEIVDIDVNNASFEEIQSKLDSLGVNYDEDGFNRSRAIDTLWKHCRKQIAGPGFLVGVPRELSPLAKADEDNPDITERFQPIIAGSELGNGYSELNDPLDQADRFEKQAALREAGDEEAQMFSKDFVEALEYGMPPTCGFGMSERVFSFLMDTDVRETQIFPLMRPKEN